MLKTSFFLALFAISLLPSKHAIAQAQHESESPQIGIGVDAGYFRPSGTWAEHPYALGVDMFGGSAIFRGELEGRFNKRLGLALDGSYNNLNLGAWEEYADARGNRIEASASLFRFEALLRFYAMEHGPHRLHLELGPTYVFPQGRERFDGQFYDYDFLKRRLGFAGGLGYSRLLSQHTALVFRVGGVFVPSGVVYADGRSHALAGVPVTLGVRFSNYGQLSRHLDYAQQ
jgi:hypothetical protein